MIIKAPYENGTIYVDGIEISIRDYRTIDLSEYIVNKLLLKDGYDRLGEEGKNKLEGKYVPPDVIRKKPENVIDKNSKRVLVVFTDGELGDRYMAFAVLRAFKVANPDLSIDLVLYPSDRDYEGYRKLFENSRYIENVFLGDVKNNFTYRDIFEIGATMSSTIEYKNKSTPKNRMEIWCNVLKVDAKVLLKTIRRESILDYTSKEIEFVKNKISLLNPTKKKKLVGIAPFSSNYFKEWPFWRWQELIDILVEKYNCICCILHASSSGSVPMLHDLKKASYKNSFVVGDLDYRVLSLFIKRLDILIGVEAAQTNIAGLNGVPFIVFTGPQSGKSYTKFYENKIVLERKWDCVSCWYPFGIYSANPNTYFVKECSHLGYAKCIYDIGVGEVIDAYKKTMKVK